MFVYTIILGFVIKVETYCDMTPEGRNSGARGDVHCLATAR
jgi:hypothetical protein